MAGRRCAERVAVWTAARRGSVSRFARTPSTAAVSPRGDPRAERMHHGEVVCEVIAYNLTIAFEREYSVKRTGNRSTACGSVPYGWWADAVFRERGRHARAQPGALFTAESQLACEKQLLPALDG